MAAIRLMRKWGVPLATAVSVPLFSSGVSADSGSKESEKCTSRMIRPSELPIYEEPEEIFDFEYHGQERTSLEEAVGSVRKEIEGAIEATRSTREKIVHICETGKAHTMATVDYITDEDNIIPRAGAITIGGLAGLVLGARKKGGLVKKVLYTSTGVAATASLCYPRQAYQISQQIYGNVKDYANIGYNFVAGVKPQSKSALPDEPKKEEPKEPAVEPSSEAEEPPSTESASTPPQEAAPVTPEPEGGEVRSVLPQALPDKKFPAPFDSLAQQSSDVMTWGFRLTDKPTSASSVRPDAVPPAEPAVPEGFGSVSRAENKDVVEAASGHAIVEESVKAATGSEIVESLAENVAEKVAEEIIEKSGEELVEKAAEVVSEVAQETEKEAKEVAEVARVVEKVSDKGASALEVVKDVVEAADKAAHETPGMSETVLDVAKEVVEKVEKVIDTVNVIAEKVEEVAEEIAKEAEDIKTKALELVENEEKREELIEEVIDYVKEGLETESVKKVVDTVAGIAEKVEEVAEDIKSKAIELVESEEKREELLEKVIDFVKEELASEPVQEMREPVEADVQEIADVKTDEEARVEVPESEIRDMAVEQDTKLEEKAAASSVTVATHLEEPTPVTLAPDVTEPKIESVCEEPVRKEGLFDKLISLFTKDDKEEVSKASAPLEEVPSDKVEVPESELIKDTLVDLGPKIKDAVEEAVLPAVEKVVEETAEKIGEVVVEKTAEVVDEISKEVEEETKVVAEVAGTVQEVGDQVASALKVADEIAEAAVEAAQAVPGLPDIVKEKAEGAKEVVEEAERVVDTVTLVAEKVREVADVIHQEAEMIEIKASELIESAEKREEFIENVVDFVTEKLQDKMDLPLQEAEPAEGKKDVSVDEPVKTVQDLVEETKDFKAEEVKPVKKEGLVDKLINLITKKEEEKAPTPVVAEEKAETEEAVTVTQEIPHEVKEHAEEKEPEQVLVEESKAVPPEASKIVELKEESIPVEEVKEQVADESEAQVSMPEEVKPIEKEGLVDKLINLFSKTDEKEVLPAVLEEKPELSEKAKEIISDAPSDVIKQVHEVIQEMVLPEDVKEGDVPVDVPVLEELKVESGVPVEQLVEEVKAATDEPLELVSEDVKEKVSEAKEGLVDKLVSLFTKSEEKEVASSVVEDIKAKPSVEQEQDVPAQQDVSADVTSEPAVEVTEVPVEAASADISKEPVIEEFKDTLLTEIKDTPSEEVEEPSAQEVQELQPEKSLEKGGLIDKLVSLFSKGEEEAEHVDDKKEISVESVDVVQEISITETQETPLSEEAIEVPAKLEEIAEVPVPADVKELLIETSVVEEPAAPVCEETVAGVQEVPKKEEEVGLFDKLVNIFSSDEKIAEPVKDESVAKADAIEVIGESEESVASEDMVIVEKVKEELPVELKETVGDKSLGIEDLVIIEKVELAPEGVKEDVAETVLELTTAIEKESVENRGLIGKLADLFSKDEKAEVEVPVKEETDSELQSPLPRKVTEQNKPIAESPEEIIEETVIEVDEKAKEQVQEVAQSTELVESVEKSEGLFDKLVSLISSSDEKQEAVVKEPIPQAYVASESPIDLVGNVDEKTEPVEAEPSPDIVKEIQVEEKGLFAKLGSLFTTDKEDEMPATEAADEIVSESFSSKAEEAVRTDDIPVSECIAPEEIPETVSQDPVLEVKDESLFSKLAELVSSNDKIPEEPATTEPANVLSQETAWEPSQESLPEQKPEAEAKVSLFDRVVSMFTKDSEPAPTAEIQTTDQSTSHDSLKNLDTKSAKSEDDQLLIVVSKPSTPAPTGDPEDGGQQSVQSSGWLQGSWLRSSSSVKQEGKDVIIQVGTEPEKDYGQSNPDDSDMYTTRS